MTDQRPTVTVFGSCRVHTPCSLLQKSGLLNMNQRNIFGFVHYTSEMIQQFELITGSRQAPSRLRPYLNIPDYWQAPALQDVKAFNKAFEATDVFVIEISSIRKIMFKALFLQINRTRELLVANESIEKNWWSPLVRSGQNRVEHYEFDAAKPLQAEIVRGLKAQDMSYNELLTDLKKIRQILEKPTVFVSHFNTNYEGGSVPQRKLIIDAMHAMSSEKGCRFFDPTPFVFEAGLEASIQDLGHYKAQFEIKIAECLNIEIEAAQSVMNY